MDRDVKEYRYMITYTEGQGWWFMDPTGTFWEGSNIFDYGLGEFLEEKQIDSLTSFKEGKVAEELGKVIGILNDNDYLDTLEDNLTEEERVALSLPPLPPLVLTNKDRIGYL